VNYNQLPFWLLFLVVLLPYHRLSHRGQNRLLLVASYLFYGFWDYRFLLLILVSTIIDFIGGLGVAGVVLSRRRLLRLAGLVMGGALLLCAKIRYGPLWEVVRERGELTAALPESLYDLAVPAMVMAAILLYASLLFGLYRLPEQSRRKWFLVVSMVANLGILGFFKYYDFFVDSFQAVLMQVGFLDRPAPLLHIILPAGISFYTFQAMSYTIDIYRREIEPTDNFEDFALFVCFFPHLVAGPIMRAHNLLPQVSSTRRWAPHAFSEGLWLVIIGLFKKIAVADNMAPIANAVFHQLASGRPEELTGAEVLVGVYAFAFQIYGDFSGYSAIARGISKWLGFELIINFRQPYLATTPRDFWRRWHIALSTWLRDYLYIPLGGNKQGVRKEYSNLIVTMLLGGLWHGASWTFVAWGLYHGVILCTFRLLEIREARPSDGWARYVGRVLVMFHLTCVGWLLFRANNFATVRHALGLIFGNFRPSLMAFTPLLLIFFYVVLLIVFELLVEGEDRLDRLMQAPAVVRGLAYTYFLAMLILFHAGRSFEFIYFQF
jgi:D-alanyl-lipoteichoic acid acyltransferase DltB (MBOAT superfamily)